jgi:hypothetical protein
MRALVGIERDFTFDTETLRIKHNPLGTTVYTCVELYSWHQDFMDEFANLDVPTGMQAIDKHTFRIVNDWVLEHSCLEWLKDGTINEVRVDGEYIVPPMPPDTPTEWTLRI